jgi:signal transduction histidine kinase
VQQINLTGKININFVANSNERFGSFQELMLYRITTELIKNTLTYANASRVDITFDYNQSEKIISFTYADNGAGFDWVKISKQKKGLGLMNIQQRVHVMKGNIDIGAMPGEGMKVFVQIPVDNKTEGF